MMPLGWKTGALVVVGGEGVAGSRVMIASDVSFLARLMNERVPQDLGQDSLAGLSPDFQPVARRLLTARPHERQGIWEDFLAGCMRFDAIAEVARRPDVAMSPTPEQSPYPAPSDESARRVKLTCAIDLKPRAIDWLWSGRVPLGMITMFAGDPKLGKSYVTLAMAGALSRGRPLPTSDRPDRPGSTILMSAEDDPTRTIVPRLVAGGADLAKIHILESVILANGSEAPPSLRADIDAITSAAIRLGDCRLIVIDPVSAYLKDVDDNRNVTLRGVLAPLNKLAEQLGAAVVLVSHLTKAGSTNGKHRVLGSIAYVGACRANFLFTADPDDPTGRRVLMLDNGSNIAPPAPPLVYTIENRDTGPRIEWSDEAPATAVGRPLKLIQSAQPHDDEKGIRHRECENWLRAMLADGPRSTVEVFQAAHNAGFSRGQIRRARCRIGAIATREGYSTEGQWSWRFGAPASVSQTPS